MREDINYCPKCIGEILLEYTPLNMTLREIGKEETEYICPECRTYIGRKIKILIY